jgi:hypothetical protein
LGALDKMKNILINKLLIFILIGLLFLVNNSNASNNNRNIDNITSKVSYDIANIVAENQLEIFDKNIDFIISDSYLFNDKNGDSLFYIFNLKPVGYIIVSADYKLSPIIAYSFTSNYKINDYYEQFFIDFITLDLELRLENIKNLSDSDSEEINVLWTELTNYDDKNYNNYYLEQWPPEGTTDTEGWIETNWHQDSPYNDFCPMDASSGERSIAGCPAVAIAQILNYHKTINNVFFDDRDDYYHTYINRFWIDDDYEEYDFPSFSEINIYLQNLKELYENELSITDEDKAALNFACGVAANQVYTSTVSGTFGVNQAFDAYMKFNCTSAELIETDNECLYDRIIYNIKNAYPVHLAVVTPEWDSGHNLIIDGYNTNNYYHLNFGWGGQYDGWYKIPDKLPFSLTVIEGVIVDIMNYKSGSDLECYGSINWINVTPNSELTGSFIVENIGDQGSMMDWEIISFPDWGEWEFNPDIGIELIDGDQVIVNVSVIAPNNIQKEFSGNIKIINSENEGDIDCIQVSLATSKNRAFNKLNLFNYFLDFFQFLYMI